MEQTVMQVGNSLAVTLPKQFVDAKKIKAGQKMLVDADNDLSVVQIRTKNSKASKITPEFKNWLDAFNTRYKTALTELAKK
ncbi:MAG: AbrB/MazE/SpoVT family DNA-binding domain-containing protein [Candidatus Levybacteria bacterium]|nr:AbrB/MazE/SpoVT family DNA-binding domain-containing protein [Candidatus Levybacteria bacterium]